MKKTILILSVLAFTASSCGNKKNPVENKFLITNNSAGYFEIGGSWQHLAENEYQFEYLQDYGSCVDACCTGGFDAGNGIIKNDWGEQRVKDLKLTFGTLLFETSDDDTENKKYKNNSDLFFVTSDNCKGWYWKDKISFIVIHSDLFKTKEGVGVGATLEEAQKKLGQLVFTVGWIEEDGNAVYFSTNSYPNIEFVLEPNDFAKGWEALSSLNGKGNTLKISDFKRNTEIKRIIIRGGNTNAEENVENSDKNMISSAEMKNVTHTLSTNELKRLNTFLSNFAEAFVTNFDVNTITPEELIGFGILHNWFNNGGRFVIGENGTLLADNDGRYRIDSKHISESIKKYFDIDFKEHRDVKGEDGYVYYRYDEKFYHCSLGDGDPVSWARIKEVYRNAAGQLKITGEIGCTHWDEDEDIYATFVAYAKPYKYNGKDTWAIISFKSNQK